MSIIILIFFLVFIICLSSAAIGMAMAGEKGLNIWIGFTLCFFLPFLGQIIYGLKKTSDKSLADLMYQRSLIDQKDYQKTMEQIISNKKNNNKK